MDEFFRKIWTGIKLMFGILLVLFGAITTISGETDLVKIRERLETEGRMAKAKIVELSIDKSTSTSRVNAMRHAMGTEVYDYHVTYEFTASNGRVMKKTSNMSLRGTSALQRGQAIDVLYHPAEPSIHRMVAYSSPYQKASLEGRLMFAAVCAAFGAFLIWRNWPFAATAETNGAGARMANVATRVAPSNAQPSAPAPLPRRTAVPAGPARPAQQGFGNRRRVG